MDPQLVDLRQQLLGNGTGGGGKGIVGTANIFGPILELFPRGKSSFADLQKLRVEFGT